MNWRISHSDAVVEDTDEWSLVAVVYGANGNTSTDDVTKSRAALIAAAPELLEALKNLVALCDPDDDMPHDEPPEMTAARAAIAKAEGAK